MPIEAYSEKILVCFRSLQEYNNYHDILLTDANGEVLFSSMYKGAADRVRLRVEAKDFQLDINRAIPCGLIINELVTNALKHAFPGEGRERSSSGSSGQRVENSG